MSGRPGDPDDRDELLTLFEEAAEFADRLMRDNEALRGKLEAVRQSGSREVLDPDTRRQELAELESAVRTLEAERRNLLDELAKAEGQNRGFAERCVSAEGAYHNLVSLYVATHQLHSTLDLSEVLRIVQEIVINLIGAEVFAVYLLDQKTRELTPVAAEGAPLDTFPPFELGSGIVGRAVESGETTGYEPAPDGGPAARKLVCVPLGSGRRAVGAIVIYRFLGHKQRITTLDRQLFDLLAAHAATAVSTARLYGRAERKLSTVQGLLGLMKD